MRFLCRLLPLICLCLLAASAWATKIVIQDPTETTVNSSPFQVTFTGGDAPGSCHDLLSPRNADYSDMGCFGFVNRTGSAWTGITLTLETGSPTNGGFTCASDVFASQTCGFDTAANTYVLSFANGAIPTDTQQYFVISEDDLPPGSLTFRADVTYATTPEPSSLMLLATGLLCAGATLWMRRRAVA